MGEQGSVHGPDATGAAADPLAIEPAPGAGHHDLRGRDDLAALIEAFYLRAFADPFIGPIFTDVAKMDLAHHLPIMCDFWESVLFDAGTYRRNALGLHVALDANHPLTEAHFERWLVLWRQTVDDGFTGDVADRAKVQGERIAASIRRRLAGGTGSAYETITTRERLEEGGTIDGPRSDGTTGGEG